MSSASKTNFVSFPCLYQLSHFLGLFHQPEPTIDFSVLFAVYFLKIALYHVQFSSLVALLILYIKVYGLLYGSCIRPLVIKQPYLSCLMLLNLDSAFSDSDIVTLAFCLICFVYFARFFIFHLSLSVCQMLCQKLSPTAIAISTAHQIIPVFFLNMWEDYTSIPLELNAVM